MANNILTIIKNSLLLIGFPALGTLLYYNYNVQIDSYKSQIESYKAQIETQKLKIDNMEDMKYDKVNTLLHGLKDIHQTEMSLKAKELEGLKEKISSIPTNFEKNYTLALLDKKSSLLSIIDLLEGYGLGEHEIDMLYSLAEKEKDSDKIIDKFIQLFGINRTIQIQNEKLKEQENELKEKENELLQKQLALEKQLSSIFQRILIYIQTERCKTDLNNPLCVSISKLNDSRRKYTDIDLMKKDDITEMCQMLPVYFNEIYCKNSDVNLNAVKK